MSEKILKNSARCTACGIEIVSKTQHDFKVHYCEKEPTPALKWIGKGRDMKLVADEGNTTFRFGVDGGKAYIRRIGDGFVDTSEVKVE